MQTIAQQVSIKGSSYSQLLNKTALSIHSMQEDIIPGDASHQHEHEQHWVVLCRHMPAHCIVNKGCIPDSAASQHPDKEVSVLDAVVAKGVVLP